MSSGTVRPLSQQSQEASHIRANVQDVLPLLPNQLALLLYRERAEADPGFLQVRFRLEGPLDVVRYEQAWRSAMAVHPSLRSSIRHRDEGDPLMIVWKDVVLPFVVEDWRTEEDPESRLERLLQSDDASGLDIATAPAMRIRLLQTHDEIYEALWTCHHLLVDGWSAAIVLEDVMSMYRSHDGSVSPPLPLSASDALRSYVTWAADGNGENHRSYWSAVLSGYSGANPLVLGSPPERSGYDDFTEEIPADSASSLSSVASEMNVPLAVVFQAAWALVLAIVTGDDDIVFGTTVSGRNADVPGMERLVGYFSNAIPVRLELDRSSTLLSWLAEFRNRQFEMGQFENASLADIHRWSDVPGHRAMFETFIVIENFPVGDVTSDDVVQRGFRSGLTTAYPITLAVGMASPWFVHIRCDRARCSHAAMRAIVDQLMRVLTAIVDHHRETVGDVMDSSGDVVSHLVTHPDLMAAAQATVVKASRTDTERRLAAIWCHHLDLPSVSVDADYFDLGGTSLGAVGMFRSIRDEFGMSLPLSTLLTHPTIERLAHVITGSESDGEVESVCLVPIQPSGTKTPIAAVHGGGGNVLIYRGLADELGPDQPLFGLQSVGINGSMDPLNTVPDMAARYIEELRQVQPQGPYRLIGFCFGGTVCLEMAAQLEDMGHEVDFIGIIDGGLPMAAARYQSDFERARYLMRSRGVLGAVRAAGKRAGWRAREWWRVLIGRIRGEARTTSVPVAMACRRAFNTFEPRPSSAPITLIRSAEEQVGEGRDWDFKWDDYTSRLEVQTVDARHKTLFEGTSVKALADIIRRALPD